MVVDTVLRSVVRPAETESPGRHCPQWRTLNVLSGLLPAADYFRAGPRGFTLGLEHFGVVVLAVASVMAGLVTLAGFGLDSLMAMQPSAVVVRKHSSRREYRERGATSVTATEHCNLQRDPALEQQPKLVREYSNRC